MEAQNVQTKSPLRFKRPWVLYVFSCLSVVVYGWMMIFEEPPESMKFDFETISSILLLLCFSAAFIFSWFREKLAGYLFIAWYVLLLAIAFFVWNDDAGMVIAGSFPIVIIGVFFVLFAYKKSHVERPAAPNQWKLVLSTLISAYAIYAVVMLIDIITEMPGSQLINQAYIYLFLLMIVFFAGVYTSFKNELIAGFILLVWYIGILVLDNSFNIGPLNLIGFPILIQAILYMAYTVLFKVIPNRNAFVAAK